MISCSIAAGRILIQTGNQGSAGKTVSFTPFRENSLNNGNQTSKRSCNWIYINKECMPHFVLSQ